MPTAVSKVKNYFFRLSSPVNHIATHLRSLYPSLGTDINRNTFKSPLKTTDLLEIRKLVEAHLNYAMGCLRNKNLHYEISKQFQKILI